MTEFIYELMVMIIATLVVFAIVAFRDRITIQRYYNTFQITPSVKLFYEWGYYVALDLAWLRWNVSITLYDRPFSYTKDELNEFEEWDTTLEDGLETEPWRGDNNNPDTNTTSETTGNPITTTTTTDETTG